MIWIKSALVGVLAAIVTVISIVIFSMTWWIDAGAGAGGMGFYSAGISGLGLLAGTLAFALAFWWTLRRQRRRADLKVGTTTG